MSILSSIGGWGLLVLLLLINGFMIWKVLSKKFWWAVLFVVGVICAFILAVVTEPNCGCLSEYTYFTKITTWFADVINMAFWFLANYFLMLMAAVAFVYWIRGQHPFAGRFVWEFIFNLFLSIIWAKLNFIYVKCLSCPLICDMEMSLKMIEECMINNFW